MPFPLRPAALLLALVMFAAGTANAGGTYPRAELLIEPQTLTDHLDGFTIVDARPREAYDKQHIPGAVWVSHAEWEQAFYESEHRDPAAWQQRIAALGISRKQPVVVYDDNLAKDAARIWWILKFYGVSDVKLLNGGWQQWQTGSFPVSEETVSPSRSNFAVQPNPERFRSQAAVLAALRKGGVQIIDARSEAEHCGEDLKENARGGAIPGAKHLEWSDLLDKQTGRFKTADEISRLFAAAEIDPQQPSITHCQSGGRASVMAFALELMGGEKVSNYYRGFKEWGNAEETPIETPES